MKTLIEYIEEKLCVNKNFKSAFSVPVPNSLSLKDVETAWGDIFDDIKQLRTGNIRLGKIKLNDNNVSSHSSYRESMFTLYVKTPEHDEILIRRTVNGRPVIWVKADNNNLDELTEKMEKLLAKEGWR